MHASVIKAREYRAQENARRRTNAAKRLMNDRRRAHGIDPACEVGPHPDGNHRARRMASHPVRHFFWELDKFFKGLARTAKVW